MKVCKCYLLLLLFGLSAPKETYGHITSKENDELIGNLAACIDDIIPLPEAPACRKKAEEWNNEKKERAAKSVFEALSKLLHSPSKFSFGKLLVGAKCNISGQTEAIMHMEIKNITACKKACDSNRRRSAYCSWIGTLEHENHKETLGAFCYVSGTITKEDEVELAKVDVCSDWRYGKTKFHRLAVPSHMTSWSIPFLMYQPPATDQTYHEFVAELGEGLGDIYQNPEGRTGLAGHGQLKYLGENRMEVPILLRRYNGTRQILVTTRHGRGELRGPLAMFYRKPKKNEEDNQWDEASAEDYFHALIEERRRKSCSMKNLLKEMKAKRKISNSYLPHPYETDNAWVKAKIYMLIVTEKSCLYNLDLSSDANYLHFQWKTYNDSRIQKVGNLISSLFNKAESRTIRTGSRIAPVNYLLCFLAAAGIISMVLAATAAAVSVWMAIAMPVAILILAAVVRIAYRRKWTSINDSVAACER